MIWSQRLVHLYFRAVFNIKMVRYGNIIIQIFFETLVI